MNGVPQYRTRRWLAPLAFAIAFAISYAVAWMIPPLQSPDEHAHLIRAYMLSKGQLALQTPPGSNSGGMVDTNLVAFVDVYISEIVLDSSARLSPQRKAQIGQLRWGGPDRFFPVPGTGYYVPLIYAPQAVGLWLGRTLNLSVANSYQLVRALCLLSCLGLLAAAFRFLRPPMLALALLLLPMTVFQLLSPTLDGITTCLAVLALSIFCRRVLAKEDLRPLHTWVLAGAIALLASSRVHLLPLLAIPFYLAWARGSRRDALAGVSALLVSVAWTLYAMTHTVDSRVQRAQSTGELVLQYATHPGAFLKIVFDSFANSELAASYEKSFIGVLAWLDTLLPAWSYDWLWIGLGLCAAASLLAAKPSEALAARAGLAVAAVASLLLVFLALLVTWTPQPATTVQGVQGRYFIVPAITLAYALGATLTPRGPRWPGWVLLCVTGVVSFYALITALLARYH